VTLKIASLVTNQDQALCVPPLPAQTAVGYAAKVEILEMRTHTAFRMLANGEVCPCWLQGTLSKGFCEYALQNAPCCQIWPADQLEFRDVLERSRAGAG
jgi:hypothetical protein